MRAGVTLSPLARAILTKMPPVSSRLPDNHVHVVFFDAEASGGIDANVWARLVEWLQPDERRRFEQFKSLDSRASFLIGRGLTRRFLADLTDVPPQDWRFVEGRFGRPEIAAPDTTLNFNLAHSGGVIACVVADARAVGVDVEHLDRRPLVHDVAARSCSPDELADIALEPNTTRQERFLLYWTLKEAYLKARGIGLSVHLPDVSFSLAEEIPTLQLRGSMTAEDPRWMFRLAQPSARHILAVAADVSDGITPEVRVFRFRADRFLAS